MAIVIRPLDVGFSAIVVIPRSTSGATKYTNTDRKRIHPSIISFSRTFNSNPLWKNWHTTSSPLKHSRGTICWAVGDVKSQKSSSKKSSADNGAAGLVGFSEGLDEDADRLVCPGCGVFMQDQQPDAPGFYVRPAKDMGLETALESEDFVEEFDEEIDEEIFEEPDDEEENKKKKKNDKIDWEWTPPPIVDEEEEWRKKLDGFAPAGPGFGNITEEDIEKKKAAAKEKKKKNKSAEADLEKEMVLVCARCHSLRHYGQVKDQNAENLLPDFDFERTVGSRLMKSTGSSRTVVVMVVDAVDFDGSFPRRAAKSLVHALERGSKAWKEGRSTSVPRLILVATKVDLLPAQISPTRLDMWVRNRARAGGVPKLSGVFLVSAHKDLGVRNLIAHIKELAGPRGNVWVIGAQNAGKSTLINAIGKREGDKVTHLTEAPVPGTTLGIIRIAGILPAKAKLYDTPGLLHPYQISMRLNREEQKMVQIRKELKPRTYRVKVGQAVHIGGLMRLDVNEASVETIYVTVWASSHIPLHMGKAENANEIKENHFGVRLQPPIGEERVSELGEWKQSEVKVSGNSWDVNSVDVAAAGLGWFSLGIKGDATLAVWTYDGVDITVREPLVLDRARFLERPGFLLSRAVSKAISNKSKLESNGSSERSEKSKEKYTDDLRTEMLSEVN